MTVAADAGRWLDLPNEAPGLRRVVDVDLAATTVCTAAVARHGRLICTAPRGKDRIGLSACDR